MTFGLEEQNAEVHFAPMDAGNSTPGERFDASMASTRIELDSWYLHLRRSSVYEQELRDHVEAETGERPETMNDVYRANEHLNQSLAADAARLPINADEYEAEVNRRIRVEYEEAQNVLADGPAGGWVPELGGALAAGALDDSTVLSLPLGVTGGVGRTVAAEFGLGAISEAYTLPRQQEMAEVLGNPDPNALQQVTLSGVLSGALGGTMAAGQRFLQYRRSRNTDAADQRPAGVTAVEHDQLIDDALEGMQANDWQPDPRNYPAEQPDADLAVNTESASTGSPPAISDFDFSIGGNASPRQNRVGYVFGMLIENGIDPHIAAGLTGNFMTESGVSLNTNAVGDGGNAFGIAQWNGPRRRAYLAYARARGVEPGDLDTQIEYVLHELRTSERRAWDRIQGAANAEDAARLVSQFYERPGIPHINRRVGFARSIFQQFNGGTVPRWNAGTPSPSQDVPVFRGLGEGTTQRGSVTAGDDFRIDVSYEVVDARALRPAAGDLQPRDRSRISSDEQIAEIAATLDPIRLMPSPEADRGAPVVGPDNIVESGNGRVAAIQRAAERFPDRYAAYLNQIAELDLEVPEGVEQPVLIARRTSDLTPESRRQFVRQANSSAVARMSATERAAVDAVAMSDDVLGLFDDAQPIGSMANKAFASRFLAGLPQAERSGMVDATGSLNKEGIRRTREAMFARAFDAPDILARFAETDAGEVRSLMDALEISAPAFAALRADIEAGAVRPEMDISEFVLDAIRLIARGRELAKADGSASGRVIEDLLSEVDLLDGAVAPLTAALVERFFQNGKARSATNISDFLKRYVQEARKVGTSDAGLFGDGPGPLQVLGAIEPRNFEALKELGQVRGARDVPDEKPEPAEMILRDEQAILEVAETDDLQITELRNSADVEVELPDGRTGTVGQILDDLEADDDLLAVIDACVTVRAA